MFRQSFVDVFVVNFYLSEFKQLVDSLRYFIIITETDGESSLCFVVKLHTESVTYYGHEWGVLHSVTVSDVTEVL